MSKINVPELLNTLPYVLSNDEDQAAIAEATAEEIVKLIGDLDLLTIYNRIDSLDEDILDILARDFKIDWWDADGTIEEKRSLLKSHWKVHRLLGTPEALKLAFGAQFDNANFKAWNEYGGNPFHFKLIVDSLKSTPDCDKLSALADRLRFYSNVRSKFDGSDVHTKKQAKLFCGTALQNGLKIIATIAAVDPTSFTWYVDELNNDLVDENGVLLFD